MKNDSIVMLSSVDLSAITGGNAVITENVLTSLGVTEADVNASALAQRWTTPQTYAHGADRAATQIRKNLVGGGDGFGTAVVDNMTRGWKF
jgi:hypothetical protein